MWHHGSVVVKEAQNSSISTIATALVPATTTADPDPKFWGWVINRGDNFCLGLLAFH